MPPSRSENQVCSHRHSFALDNLFRRLIQSPRKIIGPYLRKGDTVIDLGCGPGYFTLTMAELVGSSGRVIAVDLQEEMLAKVRSKLMNQQRQSMMASITLHQCSEHEIGLDESSKADFILACYVVHETPDHYLFFQQVRRLLKSTSTFLVIEPPFHVSNKDFAKMLSRAEQAGLTVIDRPKGKGGRSALLVPQA